MINARLYRFTLIFAFFLHMSVFAAAPSFANESEKHISDKILKNWDCFGFGKVQIELKFKVTKEGDIYKLKLTKGFEDPYAIRAAIHTVLTAMPFKGVEPEKSIVTCTITGDRKSPVVNTILSSTQPKNLKVELANVPVVENYSHQIFIDGVMAVRLRKLCEVLYDFPGSPEISSEIEKICSYFELDAKVSHDWVCMARWLNPHVLISHPSLDVENELHATTAAYLEAWRLQHDEVVLLAMEDAWIRNVAMEIEAASKDDPILSGNAALLINETKFARDQYQLAINEGESEAKNILEQMTGVSVEKNFRKLELSEEFKPTRNSLAWQTLLRWMPVDTETVVFGTKSTKEKSYNGVLSPLVDLVPVEPSNLTSGEAEKYKCNPIFSDIPEIYSLHAARSFKTSRDEGGTKNIGDSCEVLVVPEAYKESSNKIMEQLRQSCIGRQAVEGVEVLNFEKNPWGADLNECTGNCFVCSPCEGIFLVTGDIRFLQEILMRLRKQPQDRALPAENPEWKLVDTTATIWAVRHFDKAYIPFDMHGMFDIFYAVDEYRNQISNEEHFPSQYTGFTFDRRGSKFTVHQLTTNIQAQKSLTMFWKNEFNNQEYTSPESKPTNLENPKILFDKDCVKVEGTLPKRSMIMTHIFLALGYYGDI